MRLTLISLTILLCASSVLAQNAPRKIVSSPSVQPPAESTASGLGGKVSVEVEVSAAGDVTSVGYASGPDWVCPQINRPDVAALRETAKTVAKEVKFAPGEASSKEWVRVTFPARKAEEIYSAIAEPATNAGGVTVEAKRRVPKQISAGVLNGKAKSLPKPPYPPAARAARASGVVNIQVLIDEESKVFSAEPVSGHPLLLGVARTAACMTEFTQTRLAGTAVRVNGIISYNFVP
jgi:outer membrane biosynthesis protein TonB